MTALNFALSHSSAELMKLLISRGADIEVKNSNWHTLLMPAGRHRRIDLIQILPENYAKTETHTLRGVTPLAMAVWQKKKLKLSGFCLNRELIPDQFLASGVNSTRLVKV